MKKLLFFSCVMVFMSLFAEPIWAQRLWRAYPASMCSIETKNIEDYHLDGAGAIGNLSDALIGARARQIHCPVISDFAFRQEDISAIEIYFDDRNPDGGDGTDVKVQVCNQSLRTGPACAQASATMDTSTSRRMIVANPDAIDFLHRRAADFFSEVQITIPKRSAGGESKILGLVFIYSQRH